MGNYSAGYMHVPGIGKRYRDENGNYYEKAPGLGVQTWTELTRTKGNTVFDMPGFNQDGSVNLRAIPLVGHFVNAERELTGLVNSSGAQPQRNSSRAQPQRNTGGKDTSGAYMLNGRRVRDGINGIVHDAQTGQPINAATGQPMSRSAINAVINPQRTPAPETVTESTGGGASGGGGGATGSGGAGPSNTESRTNGRGVTQTGRNLGKINLTPSAGVADFTGPSFPTQPATNQISSPYPNTTPEGLEKVDLGGGSTGFANQNGRIMGLEGDPAGLSYSSNQTPATKAASYQTITPDDPIAASAFGQDWVDQHKGKATSGGSLQQALGDPNSLRFDASKYTPSEGFTPSAGAPSREEMARRSAFLDADNSLAGMRAVKAGLGVESRGQNHYANVGGKLVEMSQDDKNALLNTDMSAVADWKKNWMSSNLKSDSQPSTAQQQVPVPAQAQNPQVEQDSTPNPRAIPGRKHGPGGAFQ